MLLRTIARKVIKSASTNKAFDNSLIASTQINTLTKVEHIAKLARIELKADEKERMKKDLSGILGYIEKLNQADTSSVEPLYQTTGLVNATRADEPRAEFVMDAKLEELLIGQAPSRKERFVKVKSILKK
jgi:aspartyl-tRNA(Asn)/glutamyl-tRNA(Gln) amidotransferase subunit C